MNVMLRILLVQHSSRAEADITTLCTKQQQIQHCVQTSCLRAQERDTHVLMTKKLVPK